MAAFFAEYGVDDTAADLFPAAKCLLGRDGRVVLGCDNRFDSVAEKKGLFLDRYCFRTFRGGC